MRLVSLFLACVVGCAQPLEDGTKPDETGSAPDNTDPTAEILYPSEGVEFREGGSLTLTAQLDDEETSPDALSVSWTSTLDGGLVGTTTITGGVATTVVSAGLSEGAHTLILSVTDGDGGSATDSVSVSVVDNDAPTVTISSPTDGDVFEAGSTIEVVVQVADEADDATDLVLSWGGDAGNYAPPTSADASGEASFYMTNLEAGTRTVRVTVTDTEGGADTEEILFTVVQDADGDGYTSEDDCDDDDANVYPGAVEICDGLDQDCDGRTDEDAEDALTWYADVDGDGWGTTTSTLLACDLPAGYADNGGDCDDAVAAVNPDATEVCDTLDNNCNGLTDESTATDASTFYADADGDGYGLATSSTLGCSAPSGYVSDDTDCDDRDAAVNPAASEVCDSDDNNCDGVTDEATAIDATTWYQDADSDGYGTSDTSDVACTQPTGYVATSTDCDDANATAYPGGTEICDGADDDCDGTVDNNPTDGTTYYYDADSDGYGDSASSVVSCSAVAGSVTNSTDCDDASASVNPAATEYCDSIDNNCDGSTDEDTAADADTWYLDADADGYGVTTTSTVSCTQPTGYVALSGDCLDTSAVSYPGADEVCDSVDNDCDGDTDEDATDLVDWYRDNDGDGYGTATSIEACTQPSGYAAVDTDCDDTSALAYPGATEICDGLDNDCDGSIDEDVPTWYRDADGDGYGGSTVTTTSCTQPTDYVDNADDCDDGRAAVNPDADELCSTTYDDDCDGVANGTDSVDVTTWYADADSDGYGDLLSTYSACTLPTGYTTDTSDCDDTDADVNPDAPEICDGVDNDCDSTTEEGYAVPADYSTISAAITASVDGDSICVAAGTYYGPVDFGGKNIVIQGAGPDETFIDVNGGKVTMTTGQLIGVTLENGNQYQGSALACTTSLTNYPSLENVVFEANQCESASTCQGVVYMSACHLAMDDVTFRDNDISPAAGSITGGLIYATSASTLSATDLVAEDNIIDAYYSLYGGMLYLSSSTVDIDGLIVTGNTFDGISALYGGVVYSASSSVTIDGLTVTENTFDAPTNIGALVYASGASTTLYSTELSHVYLAENAVTADTTLYAAIYGTNNAWLFLDWADFRENTFGSSGTDYLYGSIGYTANGATLVLDQFMIAGNTIRSSAIYGGVFGSLAYTSSTSAYYSGASTLLYGDITGNTIYTNSTSAGYYVYGGIFYADYYSSSSSTAYNLDMVNIVDNTTTGGTVYGTVYYDDSSTYSYFGDFDYCNVYGNGGTAFYNYTDPTGTSGNVSLDPLYTDVSVSSSVYWDLTLQSSSPVRNSGNPSSTYFDTDGTYSAIGAYGGPDADDW